MVLIRSVGGLLLVALLSACAQVDTVRADLPSSKVVSTSGREADVRPSRQRVNVTVHRATANKVVLTGKFRPIRLDRPVRLQVLNRAWRTVSTETQDARGRVRFVARAMADGDALTYRLGSPRRHGLAAVRSETVNAAPWLTSIPDEDLSGTASGQLLSNRPAQSASLAYDDVAGALSYAHPGGLVVAGRDNFGDPAFEQVSAAGGTVLVYLNPVIDNAHGRYHRMLLASSMCGPRLLGGRATTEPTSGATSTTSDLGRHCSTSSSACWRRWSPRTPTWRGGSPTTSGSRSWFPDAQLARLRGQAGLPRRRCRSDPDLPAGRGQARPHVPRERHLECRRRGRLPRPRKSTETPWRTGLRRAPRRRDRLLRALTDVPPVGRRVAGHPWRGLQLRASRAARPEWPNTSTPAATPTSTSGPTYETLPPWGSLHPTGLPSRVGDTELGRQAGRQPRWSRADRSDGARPDHASGGAPTWAREVAPAGIARGPRG